MKLEQITPRRVLATTLLVGGIAAMGYPAVNLAADHITSRNEAYLEHYEEAYEAQESATGWALWTIPGVAIAASGLTVMIASREQATVSLSEVIDVRD
jgi:hypothetical protein